MDNIDNLTVVILTYKTDEKILSDCLDSINSNVEVLIVENSNNNLIKEKINKKYPDLNVILTGKNFGYGKGNNLGVSKVRTRYALILNPDVILAQDFFEKINKYLDQQIQFDIIGVKYLDSSTWKSSGSFEEFDKRVKFKVEENLNHESLQVVDWVTGNVMLIDLEKFNTRNLFDENIFLYFEEFDLCRRIKSKKGKIYSSKDLYVTHLGKKSSTENNHELEFQLLRNWHWMWSTFYYQKKYYGYFYAVYKTYGKFVRSVFNFFLYTILFNTKKRKIYLARILGTINAMLGKKSWYRVGSLFQ